MKQSRPSPRTRFLVLLIAMLGISGTIRGQSLQYSFATAPYDSNYYDVMAADSVPLDSVREVLKLYRTGQTDVDFIFLRDQFYLVFDVSGSPSAYIFSYFDSVEAYAAEFQYNGIDPNAFPVNCVVNGVLRYYNKE